MKAIILAGGFGSRLRSVVPDLPKPMAPIHEKPFLAYLLDYLKSQGITSVVISVHHLREKIQDYFQSQYAGMDIQYVAEDEPLGTGGAIVHTLAAMKTNEPVFVLNGDTFVKVDYRAMYKQHQQSGAALTMALRSVADTARYGKVIVQDGVVTEFREKGESGEGLINAGVYLINPDLFAQYNNLPQKFSIETEFLFPYIKQLKLRAFAYKDYFIDIGIPEDYARAEAELPAVVHKAQLPKISIIMPVLNRADTIEKAICSVIDQNYDNIEFMIFDGGSTDGTVDIIRKYEKHLTYWHSQPDKGAAAVTNIGLQKATGDLIVLLMADDWYEPNTFRKIGQALIDHPDADMITCGGRIVGYDEQKNLYVPLLSYTTANSLTLDFYTICIANISAICCRFIRKSLYDRIGYFIPFDAEGKQFLTNDKEFLLRAVLANAKDVFVNHVGHIYLAHKESYSFSNNRKSAIRHCREHMTIVDDYLKIKNLSLKNRFVLMLWYNDQSVRLFSYRLMAFDFKSALRVAMDGLRKYHVFWPLGFCYTVGRVAVKKSGSLFRK